MNEFCQAIEHMRLKISFDDVKLLFNHIDKQGQGFVSYEEFTLLLEERWRGIDPAEAKRINAGEFNAQAKRQYPKNREGNPMEVQSKSSLDIYGDCTTE